jgi:uncharacterized protein
MASTSYEKIRYAASGDRGERPTRATTQPYRDVLERLWILDPIPAWLPTRNRLARLSSPPKHHLADPALAARLLGVDALALLQARPAGPAIPREGTLLGALFESLVTLCVRVYAQAAEARTAHLRTWPVTQRREDCRVGPVAHLALPIDVRSYRRHWQAANGGAGGDARSRP